MDKIYKWLKEHPHTQVDFSANNFKQFKDHRPTSTLKVRVHMDESPCSELYIVKVLNNEQISSCKMSIEDMILETLNEMYQSLAACLGGN